MKKIIAIALVLVFTFSAVSCFAADITEKAYSLYKLGLLKGTGGDFSEESLQLDRYATRAEMCVTVVRMLGKEEKALYQKNPHPFKDVPSWASDYIGWLYENYLVNGHSDTKFGSSDEATVQQFATMLMRVLGYSDSKGDFSYDSAVNFAVKKGVLEKETSGKLLRSTMFDMCYNALKTNTNNSAKTLVKKLCDDYLLDVKVAEDSGILKEASISDSFPGVDETLGGISVYKSNSGYTIVFDDYVGSYGLRVYVQEKGSSAVKAVSLSNSEKIYMERGERIYYGAGGYLNELYIYGLDSSKQYQFIVLDTSSEGELFKVRGKSKAGEVR